MTIGQFYDGFMQTHQSQPFRPFNEGVIRGILYWLMFMKENWWDLLPEDPLSASGITPVTVPKDITLFDMVDKVSITFHDKNIKMPAIRSMWR
ncbi:MAG: hypothetical protein ACR2I2_15560 [Bryobacteraceae bacterium]